MTATHVGGHEVVAAEPVRSPLWKPDRPVMFRNILELLLDDGTTLHGCAHCDYTCEKVGQVRNHLTKAHKGEVPPATPEPVGGDEGRQQEPVQEPVETETTVEFDGDWTGEDLLAALEAALKPNDQPDLTERVAELERELKVVGQELDWWREEHSKIAKILTQVETLVKSRTAE